ncbi:unnamed protein product [Camellia sinensis]
MASTDQHRRHRYCRPRLPGAAVRWLLSLAAPPSVLHFSLASSEIRARRILALFVVVEDGYEFFADRQLVTIFSAPNYCGEFDNAGAMLSVDETLMCSFQILKPAEKKPRFGFGSTTTDKSGTPPTKTKFDHVVKAGVGCSQSRKFCGFQGTVDPSVFRLKSLRVLDLSFSGIQKLSSHIAISQHLRYLDPSQTSIKRLPNTLTNLKHLQTLRLSR